MEVVSSHATGRSVWDVHEEIWQEEVGGKYLWHRLAKEEFGQDSYVKEFSGKGGVRLRLG